MRPLARVSCRATAASVCSRARRQREQLHEKLLPVLNDAHQGTSAADAKGLSHVTEELLLELKAALTDAPAPIHQEGQIDLAV